MVTTRRRITNEKDRFGGYAAAPSSRTTEISDNTEESFARNERISFERFTDEPVYNTERTAAYETENRNVYEEETVSERYTAPAQPPVINYSTRYSTATTKAQAQTSKARKKNKDDFMPDILPAQSREMLNERTEEHMYEKSKASLKVKAALVAYITVVLALAITVIATGLAVTKMNRAADSLEREIAAKNVTLTEQVAQIHDLTDLTDPAVRARIEDAARADGMETITQSAEVELLPTNEPTKYEGRTNWFDKFCDFMSRVFGG